MEYNIENEGKNISGKEFAFMSDKEFALWVKAEIEKNPTSEFKKRNLAMYERGVAMSNKNLYHELWQHVKS